VGGVGGVEGALGLGVVLALAVDLLFCAQGGRSGLS